MLRNDDRGTPTAERIFLLLMMKVYPWKLIFDFVQPKKWMFTTSKSLLRRGASLIGLTFAYTEAVRIRNMLFGMIHQ